MEIKFSLSDIEAFEKQDRTNLINGLSGYKSAHLIGTKSVSGLSNLAIFSSIVHIGANPPLMGFVHRPATVERHTYENIKETGHFTINHVPIELYQQAHQTSARYPRNESEFDACGFTEFYGEVLTAPYVLESPIKIGLTLEEEFFVKSNQTIILIGKVQEVYLAPEFILESGVLNLSAARTLIVQGLETYYKSEKIVTLPYAKPNSTV